MKFSGIATDNLPNRNGGRFSVRELTRISELLPGSPVSFDHNTGYNDQQGRVLSAWLEQSDLSPLPQAIAKEGYWQVKFEAESSVLPKPGDGLSIATLYRTEKCPDCNCDAASWLECPRSMQEIRDAGYVERVEVEDVLEISLVLIPAVKGAQVISASDSVNPNLIAVSREAFMGTKLAQDVVGDSVLPEKPTVETTPEPVADSAEIDGVILTAEEVEAMLKTQSDRDEEIAKLKAENDRLSQAAQDAETQAEEARKAAKAAELKTKLGAVMPSVNKVLSPSRDAQLNQGLVAEWQSIIDSAPNRTAFYGGGTRYITQRDESEMERFFLDNKRELIREMDGVAKSHGLLRGKLSTDAPTLRADIPDMFLAMLGTYIRMTHVTQRIFWQFPRVEEDFSKVPGDTIKIKRWSNLTEPSAEADFTLTPGTALNSTPGNLSETSVSVVLEEKGLGKSGVTGFEPIGIPEFIAARSIEDLLQVVQERLGIHYEACEDFMIRSKYQTTTAIRYNDNNAVTATPAHVGTGDGGLMTENFLHDMYSEMSSLLVPAMDDECYILALNPKAAAQLRNSVADKVEYKSMEYLLDILLPAGKAGKTAGYIGTVGGFHCFQTNSFGVGTAGNEGVQNVTLGTGSVLTRSSWAFGKAAVGRAVSMPVQVRMNDDNSFGRLQQYIWISHENCHTLDVDPNNNASEQLRVFEIRTPDVAQ